MQFALVYSPYFVRAVKKLPRNLQEEVDERLQLFKNEENHERLKFHALKGKMKGLQAFSVNYHVRVVVKLKRDICEVYVLDVGDHSIYE